MIAVLSNGYDKRISSLIAMVAIVVGALFVIVDAAMGWRGEALDIANLRMRTEMLEARAATASGGQGAASAGQLDARLLIVGSTSGLVSAELQRIVSSIAVGVGAAVRSLDVPESEPVGDIADANGNRLVRVRLNAEIEVMEPALPDLLHAIETYLPILVVDSMSLRPNRRIGTTTDDATYSTGDRPLALRLTISAFHLKGPA